ncbi:MAG: hypothetical protein KDD25_05985, partial [Bdellovibrionales bacterium]|nr:hypothetical protein [Bdellovibrionales bacterium]
HTVGQIQNRRILVVEDEAEIAALYKSILTSKKGTGTNSTRSSRSSGSGSSSNSSSFEIVCCANSDQALLEVKAAIQKGQPFAMGFFDVLLEGSRLDGISLVKEIFELDPNMKAVFVTAYQDRSVDSIHELLGEKHSDRWDYLNKPFSQGEILQKSRASCSLWTLERIRESQDLALQEAQSRLMESDRFSTVAAVSRSVGHEFGNLLVHISGNAELHRNGTDAEKENAFKIILDACDTARSVLDKLKALADNRTVDDTKIRFDIREPVHTALRLLDHQFRTQNVKICLIKNEECMAFGRPAEIVQVIVNLLINALHAMGNSGQIDISISKVGEFAEILVHDYGPGIPEKLMTRVTEPLFTTKGKDGTGLGLSICKEIIEIQHSGVFKIQNHSSKGAVVSVRVPLFIEQEKSNDQKKSA